MKSALGDGAAKGIVVTEAAVSILVLVKSALGGRERRRRPADGDRGVSILVLVKSALGDLGDRFDVYRRVQVSILVLVKSALGASQSSARRAAASSSLNSCSGEVCPRGSTYLKIRRASDGSQFLFW